jgi:hypothetical protein
MNKPYLMVFEHHRQIHVPGEGYKGVSHWVGHWLTGPEAANWIAIRSNEQRPDYDAREKGAPRLDSTSLDTPWIKGNLKEAKLYKLLVEGEYDTLQCIYSSDSLSASQFCDGVLSMQDLLFDIEW